MPLLITCELEAVKVVAVPEKRRPLEEESDRLGQLHIKRIVECA
jgi:hypothetical protein